MIHYDDHALQLIESEIINIYNTDVSDYTQCECLLIIHNVNACLIFAGAC